MSEKITFCLLLFLLGFAVSGQTNIKGRVTDDRDGNGLPYVNVAIFKNALLFDGTTTSENGYYEIKSPITADSISFGFVGYGSQGFHLSNAQNKSLNVELKSRMYDLQTVEVKAKRAKYSRKDNPALILIKQVAERYHENSPQSADYFENRSHTKIELSVLGLNDSLMANKHLKALSPLIENLAPSPLSGRTFFPIYFMEQLKENYYRQKPESSREIIIEQKATEPSKFLDLQSMENLLEEIVTEVDLSKTRVHLLSNDFLSPLSKEGVFLYHFSLGDTILYKGRRSVEVLFAPSSARDIGLSGRLIVSLDSNHALLGSEFGVYAQSGLNFVEQFRITQSYEHIQGKMVKTLEMVNAEFNLYGLEFGLSKRTLFADFVFGKARSEDFYGPFDLTRRLSEYNKRLPSYWETNRIEPLSEIEKQTYAASYTLNNHSGFKWISRTLMAFVSGYVELGKIDVGTLENTISYNDVEGLRLRLGAKTNTKFNKHIFFEGFVAYGLRDEKPKYRIQAMYSLNEKLHHQWEFPKNLISLSYEANTRIHGQQLLMGEPDRLFLSFNRGSTDKMSFDRTLKMKYEFEFQSQLSLQLAAQYQIQQPLARLHFVSYDRKRVFNQLNALTFEAELRYAKGEKFYQQQQYRLRINTSAPIYTFSYSYTPYLSGGDWSFHKLNAKIEKRYYVFNLGYADLELQAGKIFGSVPFPFMFIHHANQNLAYQDEAFNLMNYYEFLSDHYASLILNYNFNGVIFNRIPLIGNLKWREVFAVKVLWGGVEEENMPSKERADRMDFPRDEANNYTTFPIGSTPYIEANVGIDNIFKVLRLDLVKRFTHLDNPSIAKWGIRFRLRFTF